MDSASWVRAEPPQLGPGRAPPAGSGQSPGRKWFYCNLISADRFYWQQGQEILHLFVLKNGVTVPLSPKSGGTGTPRNPVNYAYA